MSEDTKELKQKLGDFLSLYGINQFNYEPADPDEEYAVFSSGPHSETRLKRVAKPSYRQQEQVAEVLLRANPQVYPEESKVALCAHHGLDKESISGEYSQKDIDERVLPLICRNIDQVEGWDIADASSAEIERMRIDFLADT